MSDARMKIIHEFVTISFPAYFQQHMRRTRHSHILVLILIHNSFNFHKYSFFPLAAVQVNNMQAEFVVFHTLEQFRAVWSHVYLLP